MTGHDDSDLRATSAVVTGAGRGLGAALAIALADRGCAVILCGRSTGALAHTAGRIARRGGTPAACVALDLTSPQGIAAATTRIVDEYPVLDLLVNNGAAWLGRRETPYTADEVHAVVASAVSGTFLLTQGLLPALARSGRPDVVTIGSITGLPGSALHEVSVPFHAAKHAQVAMADGLRQMLAGTPVRSMCINPPWLEDIAPDEPAWEAAAHRAKGETATNRDVVEAVLFAVTRPRHVTIASLSIDADRRGIDTRGHAARHEDEGG